MCDKVMVVSTLFSRKEKKRDIDHHFDHGEIQQTQLESLDPGEGLSWINFVLEGWTSGFLFKISEAIDDHPHPHPHPHARYRSSGEMVIESQGQSEKKSNLKFGSSVRRWS